MKCSAPGVTPATIDLIHQELANGAGGRKRERAPAASARTKRADARAKHQSLFATPAVAGRETALFQRLTPDWQDEGALFEGLGRSAQVQAWLVAQSGLAERRRFVLGGVIKWKLRLAGGK